jgi:demethoxyubiquinone hydroxylase (CLK1/Coq7/Cat5 family)
MGGTMLDPELFDTSGTQKRSAHKKSSSGSSFGFVTAVKSASISLASFSVAPRSRRTGVSSRQQRTDRSSKASNVGRLSEDSSYIARGIVIDQAVTNRLLQRRRVLEEIISTEESYLADVRFLMNVRKSIHSPKTFLTFARFM